MIRRWSVFSLLAAMLPMFIAWVCVPQPGTSGALVDVTATSTVAVVLDDIPAGSIREAVVSELLAEPGSFWVERAEHQLDYAYYHMTFRPFFYAVDTATGIPEKGQLPLPPNELWEISIAGPAVRTTSTTGQDVVQVEYDLHSMLISDTVTVAVAEPALGSIGGTWTEELILPLDPYLVIQRTTPVGYTAANGGSSPCVDEYGYPPKSWDAENGWQFFDVACTDTATYCALNGDPGNCIAELEANTGTVVVPVEFKRVKWKKSVADLYRNVPVPSTPHADLVVHHEPPGLQVNRVSYDYVPEGDCAIEEGCVLEAGWRRLLKFDSVNHNIGAGDMHIGSVEKIVEDGRNFMVYHECHEHFHFNYYGRFDYEGSPGSKLSFCLVSTNRLSNNETTPLANPYIDCNYQGISAGWGDMYQAGLPCQWIDVTEVDTTAGPVTNDLVSTANPMDVLCEGEVTLDADGEIADWYETDIIDHGNFVWAPVCDESVLTDTNNVGAEPATVQSFGEGFVTQPCDDQQIGPLRDCGFDYEGAHDCIVGEEVTVTAATSGQLQPVVRICEKSAVLGAGVACTYLEQVAQELGSTVTFTCPEMRDALGSGGYSVYVGDIL